MQPNLVYNLIPPTVKDWTPGRDGNRPQWIALHTTDCSLRQAEAGFAAGNRQASAHRIIGLNGDDVIEVSDGDTTWGAANWYVNERGFNLEHEDNGNYNDAVRTPQLYAAGAWQVADWCRRYGIPCRKANVVNHTPTEPGIVLHQEVSLTGTACPDGLDWQRIIAEAQAILGGAAPIAIAQPAIAGFTAWGPGKVRVTVQTLRVHPDPTLGSAGDVANTPDGMLHSDQLADCNGWVRGDQYTIGDQVSDLWCHSPQGHFFAALGTDAPFVNEVGLVVPPPPPPAPVPEPAPIAPAPAAEWVSSYAPGPGQVLLNTDAIAHDFEGKTEDRTLPPNTLLDVAGTFTVQDVLYLRSVWSAQNGRWIGIPKSTTGPYVGPPTTLASLTKPQEATGFLASVYGQLQSVIDSIKNKLGK